MGDTHNKRGKKFLVEQDVAICRAWLSISQDPLVGNSQTHGYFWSRVFNNYLDICNDKSRTQGSIQSRWGVILKSCNKYRGCISAIENLHPSGMTQADLIGQAKILYHQEVTKPFVLDHCWEVLQFGVKWQDMFPTTPKTISADMGTSSYNLESPGSQTPNNFIHLDSDATPSGASVESPRKRPSGIKKEKEARSRRKTDEAMSMRFVTGFEDFNKNIVEKNAKKAEREERRIQALQLQAEMEKKEQERREQQQDDEIMDKDLSTMNPRQRAYYEMRQNEIMDKMRARANSGQYYVPLRDFD